MRERKSIEELVRDVPASRVIARDIRLTAKQKAFVDKVAIGATNTQAYIEAYGSTMDPRIVAADASNLRSNPKVSHAIALQQAAERVRYSQNPIEIRSYVVDSLQHLARTAQRPADRLRALELLGKMADVALFETRTVVEHRKPDDVRAALVSKLRRFVLTDGTMDAQEATPTLPGEAQTGRASRAAPKPIIPHESPQKLQNDPPGSENNEFSEKNIYYENEILEENVHESDGTINNFDQSALCPPSQYNHFLQNDEKTQDFLHLPTDHSTNMDEIEKIGKKPHKTSAKKSKSAKNAISPTSGYKVLQKTDATLQSNETKIDENCEDEGVSCEVEREVQRLEGMMSATMSEKEEKIPIWEDPKRWYKKFGVAPIQEMPLEEFREKFRRGRDQTGE